VLRNSVGSALHTKVIDSPVGATSYLRIFRLNITEMCLSEGSFTPEGCELRDRSQNDSKPGT
jgi:hypothetical protein